MATLAMLVVGGLGALARFEVAGWVQRTTASDRPWGTMAVNLLGAAGLGVLLGLADQQALGDDALRILGTGFFGGFTTFSTWMVAGATLLEEGAWRDALLHLVGQLVVGIAAAALMRLMLS